MQPFFNTAGPCIPGKHHMLPPQRRLTRALKLIEQEKYFVLRAGRQTGKTTSARWMVGHLRKTGRYEALWVDLQPARELSDPTAAFPVLLDCFVQALSVHPELPCPKAARVKGWLSLPQTAMIGLLGWLSSKSKKPLVLFLDEADGKLDMPRLMAAWQEFWREDGHLAAEGFNYREAGPHLMLMAFLQRVLNGGGRLDRAYALGRGALDLLVTWKGERHAIEVKVRRDEQTEGKAVEQVGRYRESLGLKEGWVVLFDRRTTVGWEEKVFEREHRRGDTRVIVLGC
jgi:hypothetical protein